MSGDFYTLASAIVLSAALIYVARVFERTMMPIHGDITIIKDAVVTVQQSYKTLHQLATPIGASVLGTASSAITSVAKHYRAFSSSN